MNDHTSNVERSEANVMRMEITNTNDRLVGMPITKRTRLVVDPSFDSDLKEDVFEGGRRSSVAAVGGAFNRFCDNTSLHGWKYLSGQGPMRAGWVGVVLASMGVAVFFLLYCLSDFLSAKVQTTQATSRASLDHVFFPAVTVCNINQGRRSFFVEHNITDDNQVLGAVLGQLYLGLEQELTTTQRAHMATLFAGREVVSKGLFTDAMYMRSVSKSKAANLSGVEEEELKGIREQEFVSEAGWYFKTLAAQEAGHSNILSASFGDLQRDTEERTELLPFFGTDYGLCSLIKPQITFDPALADVPFDALMLNHTRDIRPGVKLGKENGLTLLLDAETYDYAFAPQRGEGFKLAIHSPMDQPIMAFADLDLSPGFVTQLAVTPTLVHTTDEAMWRFTPKERGCFADQELRFKYLPSMYRYSLSNCLFAATYEVILSKCRCVPFFHTTAFDDYPRICSGVALACMNAVLRDIGSHDLVRAHKASSDPKSSQTTQTSSDGVECLFACHDQRYRVSVSTSVFPNEHTFLDGPELCLMVRKIRASCTTSKLVTLNESYAHICDHLQALPKLCSKESDSSTTRRGVAASESLRRTLERSRPRANFELGQHVEGQRQRTAARKLAPLLQRYARENLLVANIYIKDPSVTLIRRDQKIPVIWFVANVGGILGLCMGCSLVTVFEVLHHVGLLFLRTGHTGIRHIRRSVRPNVGQRNKSDEAEENNRLKVGNVQLRSSRKADLWNKLTIAKVLRNGLKEDKGMDEGSCEVVIEEVDEAECRGDNKAVGMKKPKKKRGGVAFNTGHAQCNLTS